MDTITHAIYLRTGFLHTYFKSGAIAGAFTEVLSLAFPPPHSVSVI